MKNVPLALAAAFLTLVLGFWIFQIYQQPEYPFSCDVAAEQDRLKPDQCIAHSKKEDIQQDLEKRIGEAIK